VRTARAQRRSAMMVLSQLTFPVSGIAALVDDAAREILPWLDRYLGPVAQSSRAGTRK
jgi:hypothetical protein